MHKRIEFKQNQTLLFIGDSITDCGRRESSYAPLGCGYVNFTANFLLASRPQLKLNIQNRGISGDTTRDLKRRWDSDCLALRPDIVSIMIGINDLWFKYGESPDIRMYISPEEYEANLRDLLSQTRDACGSQLILMEPFMFCDDAANPMLADLPAYIDVVHQTAEKFGALLVPLHTNYTTLKDKRPADQWADDTVHPATWAHAWIAKQWLQEVIGSD